MATKRVIKLKCHNQLSVEKEVRLLVLDPSSAKFEDLKRRLCDNYGWNKIDIKYQDADGDIIVLQNQSDLDALFSTTEDASAAINVFVAPADMRASGGKTTLQPINNAGSRVAAAQRRQPSMPSNSPTASQQSPLEAVLSELSLTYPTGGSGAVKSSSTTITSGRPHAVVTDAAIGAAGGGRAPSPSSSVGGRSSSAESLRHRSNSASDHSKQRAGSNNSSLAPVTSSSSSPDGFRWQRGQRIGAGAYGTVYLGLNAITGELMAVKQLDTAEVSAKELAALEHEISMLKALHHENIVQYYGTERTETALSIFLEYCPGGSLRQVIDRFGVLEESVIRAYTRQLLLGLEYLHRNGIAHRDIKGGNVLVGSDGICRVADFGQAKRLGGSRTMTGDIEGTPLFMAPEVIREQNMQKGWRKADIWSVGCTVIEMATGRPPWSEFANTVTVMYTLACTDATPALPDHLSPQAMDFLSLCFRRDPAKRPDITLLLLHPFVAATGGSMMTRGFASLPGGGGVNASGSSPFGSNTSAFLPPRPSTSHVEQRPHPHRDRVGIMLDGGGGGSSSSWFRPTMQRVPTSKRRQIAAPSSARHRPVAVIDSSYDSDGAASGASVTGGTPGPSNLLPPAATGADATYNRIPSPLRVTASPDIPVAELLPQAPHDAGTPLPLSSPSPSSEAASRVLRGSSLRTTAGAAGVSTARSPLSSLSPSPSPRQSDQHHRQRVIGMSDLAEFMGQDDDDDDEASERGEQAAATLGRGTYHHSAAAGASLAAGVAGSETSSVAMYSVDGSLDGSSAIDAMATASAESTVQVRHTGRRTSSKLIPSSSYLPTAPAEASPERLLDSETSARTYSASANSESWSSSSSPVPQHHHHSTRLAHHASRSSPVASASGGHNQTVSGNSSSRIPGGTVRNVPLDRRQHSTTHDIQGTDFAAAAASQLGATRPAHGSSLATDADSSAHYLSDHAIADGGEIITVVRGDSARQRHAGPAAGSMTGAPVPSASASPVHGSSSTASSGHASPSPNSQSIVGPYQQQMQHQTTQQQVSQHQRWNVPVRGGGPSLPISSGNGGSSTPAMLTSASGTVDAMGVQTLATAAPSTGIPRPRVSGSHRLASAGRQLQSNITTASSSLEQAQYVPPPTSARARLPSYEGESSASTMAQRQLNGDADPTAASIDYTVVTSPRTSSVRGSITTLSGHDAFNPAQQQHHHHYQQHESSVITASTAASRARRRTGAASASHTGNAARTAAAAAAAGPHRNAPSSASTTGHHHHHHHQNQVVTASNTTFGAGASRIYPDLRPMRSTAAASAATNISLTAGGGGGSSSMRSGSMDESDGGGGGHALPGRQPFGRTAAAQAHTTGPDRTDSSHLGVVTGSYSYGSDLDAELEPPPAGRRFGSHISRSLHQQPLMTSLARPLPTMPVLADLTGLPVDSPGALSPSTVIHSPRPLQAGQHAAAASDAPAPSADHIQSSLTLLRARSGGFKRPSRPSSGATVSGDHHHHQHQPSSSLSPTALAASLTEGLGGVSQSPTMPAQGYANAYAQRKAILSRISPTRATGSIVTGSAGGGTTTGPLSTATTPRDHHHVSLSQTMANMAIGDASLYDRVASQVLGDELVSAGIGANSTAAVSHGGSQAVLGRASPAASDSNAAGSIEFAAIETSHGKHHSQYPSSMASPRSSLTANASPIRSPIPAASHPLSVANHHDHAMTSSSSSASERPDWVPVGSGSPSPQVIVTGISRNPPPASRQQLLQHAHQRHLTTDGRELLSPSRSPIHTQRRVPVSSWALPPASAR